MSLTLGEKLRQAREERGISISEVAEQTRISPHYLDLIEQDDYRTLPGGIFNKGFVKSYAKYVGIDEQEALQDYASLISQQEGVVTDDPKTYRPEVLTDDRASSSMLPTIIFAVIILTGMTIGLLYLVNYIQNSQSPAVNTNSTVNSNAVNTNAPPVTVPTAAPATDKISVELKAVNEEVWTSYAVDDNKKNLILKPGEPLKIDNVQKSFKFTFPKDKSASLQLTVNGKQVSLPTAPANPKRNTIDVEINKTNAAQILQSGQIGAETTAPATQR